MRYKARMKSVHERIHHARERAGLTQAELATALNVQQPRVSRWERIERPRPQRLRQMAEVLAVSLPWLTTGEGKP